LHKSQINYNKITQVHETDIGHGIGVSVKWETATPQSTPLRLSHVDYRDQPSSSQWWCVDLTTIQAGTTM